MDDYSALAQRIAVSVNGVRGSLILSRDGMVLGAYPDADESLAKPAWLKFVTLGEPDKSFVEFGDQVWAFVKRGAYAAFCVAEAGIRPGILVDQMEQVLLVAEDGRARRDTLRLPDASTAPSGKPRTSLHPPSDKPQPAEIPAPVASASVPPVAEGSVEFADPVSAPIEGGAIDETLPLTASEAPTPAPALETPQEPPIGAPTTLSKEPKKLVSSGDDEPPDDDSEVDRVLLAKEFSGLLQMDSGDDEDSS